MLEKLISIYTDTPFLGSILTFYLLGKLYTKTVNLTDKIKKYENNWYFYRRLGTVVIGYIAGFVIGWMVIIFWLIRDIKWLFS